MNKGRGKWKGRREGRGVADEKWSWQLEGEKAKLKRMAKLNGNITFPAPVEG